MDSYAVKVIRKIDDSVNAVGAGAAMRVHYVTLSHGQEPGFLRGCCHGAAHKARFDAYEGRRSIVVFRR